MYQPKFNPSWRFYTYVAPFLGKLPKAPSEKPLSLLVPLQQVSSIRYQWYNYFKHHKPNTYMISQKPSPDDPSHCILTITHRGNIRLTELNTNTTTIKPISRSGQSLDTPTVQTSQEEEPDNSKIMDYIKQLSEKYPKEENNED